MLVVYILTMMKMKALMHEEMNMLQFTGASMVERGVTHMQRRIALIPLAFVLIRLPGSIHRISEMAHCKIGWFIKKQSILFVFSV